MSWLKIHETRFINRDLVRQVLYFENIDNGRYILRTFYAGYPKKYLDIVFTDKAEVEARFAEFQKLILENTP